MSDMLNSQLEQRKMALRQRYGELLDLNQVAELFRYPSIGAVRKAKSRGVLQVKLYRFPNRNGQFAKTDEVALAIEAMTLA